MPDPNPSERLAEIEARVEAATPEPWKAGDGPSDTHVASEYRDGEYAEMFADIVGERPHDDAAFLAHAREDIPWLLEQLREAREFIMAHTLLDKGVVDFDLHAETVERFRRASEQPGVVSIIRQALADSGEASGEAGSF